MRMWRRGLVVGMAVTLGLGGCSRKPKAPPRADLEAQLRQEAEALKAANENQDTSLGVSTTWTVDSVDVVEQPDNADAPWRGTIRFQIKAETRDTGGKVQVDEFAKEFAYVFNPTLEKWVFEYQP